MLAKSQSGTRAQLRPSRPNATAHPPCNSQTLDSPGANCVNWPSSLSPQEAPTSFGSADGALRASTPIFLCCPALAGPPDKTVGGIHMPNLSQRNLALELVRVTEAAALAAGRWYGKVRPRHASTGARSVLLSWQGSHQSFTPGGRTLLTRSFVWGAGGQECR